MTQETIFRTVFWLLLAGVLLMRVYFAIQVRRARQRLLPDQKAIEREGRGAFAVRAASFFLLIGWLVLYAVNPPWLKVLSFPLPAWLRWIGAVLGAASLALWYWSQAELGTRWSAQLQLRQEHTLVTSGPYATMRHPLYTGMVGWGLCCALVTANWVFVVIAALTISVFFLRVPKEEQMMIEAFGEEYRDYMQRTGRFMPKL